MSETVFAVAACLVLLGVLTNFFELVAAVLIAWAVAFSERGKK